MIQTFVISILSILIIIVAFLIVLVGSIGILRIVVVSVFEFDFIKWIKTKKKPKTKINFKDLPKIYLENMEGEEDEN